MKTRLLPRLVICSSIAASVPALTATMTITEAVPMMMPSMVRNERSLFLRMLSQAVRRNSRGIMPPPRRPAS